jgi:hypothetical protein
VCPTGQSHQDEDCVMSAHDSGPLTDALKLGDRPVSATGRGRSPVPARRYHGAQRTTRRGAGINTGITRAESWRRPANPIPVWRS